MEAWMVATTIIFLYLVFVLLLGWLANRKLTVDIEDFFLYRRKAGFVILYFTVVSTYFSAFAFLGSAGFFYTHGIGFWDAGSWTLMAGITTYVIGPRIWGIGKRFGYINPGFIVQLVVLSSAGTLQLWPALIGNLFPSRFRFSAVGIIAGMIAGLVALYYTSLVHPNPLTLHGGIWALGTNLLVAAVVSHFTRKPSPETVNRIHSVIEELAYPA